jgi:hypothetical protein
MSRLAKKYEEWPQNIIDLVGNIHRLGRKYSRFGRKYSRFGRKYFKATPKNLQIVGKYSQVRHKNVQGDVKNHQEALKNCALGCQNAHRRHSLTNLDAAVLEGSVQAPVGVPEAEARVPALAAHCVPLEGSVYPQNGAQHRLVLVVAQVALDEAEPSLDGLEVGRVRRGIQPLPVESGVEGGTHVIGVVRPCVVDKPTLPIHEWLHLGPNELLHMRVVQVLLKIVQQMNP